MPRKTKRETRDELLALAVLQVCASFVFDEHEDLLHGYRADEDWDLGQDNGLAETLQLSGTSWTAIAESFYARGPGSRGSYGQIPLSADFFSCCLQAPNRVFRHIFRISRDTFDRLVALLSQDPVFESHGRWQQRHVKYQLGTFLVRYGARGSDSLWVAQKLSISHGSVFNYCKRVRKAIRHLRDDFVGWPTAARKAVISSFIEDLFGFEHCIGSGDGSLIRFSATLILQGYAYMTRKKYFGTNIQATNDHELRITSYELGTPGSVPDAKVWKRFHIWMNRRTHFDDGEYILVDKGYPSSPYVLRPFSDPELHAATAMDRAQMKKFNQRLSSVRIWSEHTFGILKARFPSLKDLGPHRDLEDAYEAIESMIILHNICIDWGDRLDNKWWVDIMDVNGESDGEDEDNVPVGTIPGDDPAVPEHETDAWLKDAGYRKRWEITQ